MASFAVGEEAPAPPLGGWWGCRQVLSGVHNTSDLWGVTPLQDGRLASVGDDGFVCVTDLATATTVHRLAGHTERILSCVTLPSGHVASGGADRSVRVWNLESEAPGCVAVLGGHTKSVWGTGVVHTPDGTWRLLSCGDDHSVKVGQSPE
jgi:WD40 repeat protein